MTAENAIVIVKAILKAPVAVLPNVLYVFPNAYETQIKKSSPKYCSFSVAMLLIFAKVLWISVLVQNAEIKK